MINKNWYPQKRVEPSEKIDKIEEKFRICEKKFHSKVIWFIKKQLRKMISIIFLMKCPS